jgi:hypothetical protein
MLTVLVLIVLGIVIGALLSGDHPGPTGCLIALLVVILLLLLARILLFVVFGFEFRRRFVPPGTFRVKAPPNG